MKIRNPVAVFFLPIITFGIYAIYWYVKTKEELKAKGANIPTAWLLIVPIVNLYWLWLYAQGVEKATNSAFTAPVAFILLLLLGSIGMAIVQNKFNTIGEAPKTT